jgi:hypothetical protein
VKQSIRPRKTASLSKSLNHRLNSYALAASAAGVGVLALTQLSEAKIVYTPDNRQIENSHRVPLDLNHDGVVDFTFWTHFRSSAYNYLGLKPARRNAVADAYSCWFDATSNGGRKVCEWIASELAVGSRIGPKTTWKHDGAMRVCFISSTMHHPYCDTRWYSPVDAYLGLKFRVKGKVHYGWEHVKPINGSFVSVGYAYETVPDKPIVVGKTHGPDVITVQPAALGHLARGASAIPAWRKTEGNR